jgi:hypothetical protein
MWPRRPPHWDAEHLGFICSSYVCMYQGYSVFQQERSFYVTLHRTLLPKMVLQLRRDSPQCHAGPLIGMLSTWGSYVALTRVCTMDIEHISNKGPCMSWLQRTVLPKMDLQLRRDSPHCHVGPLTGIRSTLRSFAAFFCMYVPWIS